MSGGHLLPAFLVDLLQWASQWFSSCMVTVGCRGSEQCWDQVPMWDQSHCNASLTLECWVMSSITNFSLFLEPKVCFGEILQVILFLSLASKPLGQHVHRLVLAPQKPLPWFYPQAPCPESIPSDKTIQFRLPNGLANHILSVREKWSFFICNIFPKMCRTIMSLKYMRR